MRHEILHMQAMDCDNMRSTTKVSSVANGNYVRSRPRQHGEGSIWPEPLSPLPQLKDEPPQDENAGPDTATSQAPSPTCLLHALGNAFTGIALLEITEASLARIFALLQEAHQLVLHAGEPRRHAVEIAELNRDLQCCLKSIDEIAESTTFKGRKILLGGLGTAYFQVSRDISQRLCINLDNSVRCSSMGKIATAASAVLTTLFGTHMTRGSYTTPPILDLNFFTVHRQALFTLHGITIGLYRNWNDDPQGAASALQESLNSGNSTDNYTVTYTNYRFTITSNHGPAPALFAASVRGMEFMGGATVESQQPPPLTLAEADFMLQLGTTPAISITGSFSSLDELSDAIQLQLPGAAAARVNHSTGTFEINAYETITISGVKAESPQYLGFRSRINPPQGSLSTIELLEEDARGEARQRLAAALTYITTLRAAYGEIKKRFFEALNSMPASGNVMSNGSLPLLDASAAAAVITATQHQLQQQAELGMQAQANAHTTTVKALLNRPSFGAELTFCHLRCDHGAERCR
jgi:flagellin-like hook-associated protein FlgL